MLVPNAQYAAGERKLRQEVEEVLNDPRKERLSRIDQQGRQRNQGGDTVRQRCSNAKQFFNDALERGLIYR